MNKNNNNYYVTCSFKSFKLRRPQNSNNKSHDQNYCKLSEKSKETICRKMYSFLSAKLPAFSYTIIKIEKNSVNMKYLL